MRTAGIRLLALLTVILVLVTSPVWAQTTTVSAVLQSAAAANGNGTVADTTGYALITVQITLPSGAPSFTVNFEVSLDTSTWDAGYCMPIAGGATVTTATATGEWRCNVTGQKRFRARISGYTGPGSISVFGVLFAARPAILGSDSVASQRAGR